MSINVRFSASAEATNSQMYSLEQLAIHATDAAALPVRIDMGNFDATPSQGSTGAIFTTYTVTLVVSAGSGASLPLNAINLPLFLGAPRKDINVDLSFDKVNDGVGSLAVSAQGYFWGPGAINAEGGPQRPPSSLYGT